MVRKSTWLLLIGLLLGSATVVSTQGPFASQIQTAIRNLLSSNQTITGTWTFSTIPVGIGPTADVTCTGTNDHTAINAAITALTSGGRIEISAGTCSLGAAITVNQSNIVIEGQGDSTILKLADSVDAKAFNVTATGARIRNLEIDGNSANHTTHTSWGVYGNANDLRVENVHIINMDGNMIDVQAKTQVFISGCILDTTLAGSAGYGIYFGGSDSAITDTYITGTASYGIDAWGSRVNIKGNTIYAPTANSAIRLEGQYTNVEGNYVESSNTSTAIRAGDNNYNRVIGNKVVVNAAGKIGISVGLYGSAISNTIVSASTVNGAIGIDIDSYNAEVVGNNIWHSSNSGTTYTGIFGDAQSKIENNGMRFAGSRDATGINMASENEDAIGNYIDFEGSGSYIGIQVGSFDDLAEGNIIYHGTTCLKSINGNAARFIGNKCENNDNGLLAAGLPNGVISGNSFEGKTTGTGIGISITTTTTGLTISGNSIYTYAAEGISLAVVSNSTITGNTIKAVGQATNNTYAAIYLKTTSTNNVVSGNTVYSAASNKHSYGVREDSASDGPTAIVGNSLLNAVTANISTQHASSYSIDAGVVTVTTVGTVGTVTSGVWNAGAVTSSGAVTGLFVANGSAPAVDDTSGGNSCGTAGNPSMVANSTNNAGAFNVGAGGGTDCTVTFTVAAAHFWQCSVSDQTSAVLTRAVSVNTTTTKFQGVLGAADVIGYNCLAF